jgi:hypothetical protein
VEGLEDEANCQAAATALLAFGQAAVHALTAGSRERKDKDGAETPGSQARRSACARLLAALGGQPYGPPGSTRTCGARPPSSPRPRPSGAGGAREG